MHIVLVPDLDTAGQAGAQLTGGRLAEIAANVRVARLPGEIVEKSGDDVRDVLSRADGEKLVRDTIVNAEPWQPREGEHDPKEGRPEVTVTLDYRSCVDQVVSHLGQLGWASPWISNGKRERLKLFQRGGVLVQVVTDETAETLSCGIEIPKGMSKIRPLPPGQLLLRIADACNLVREVEKGGEIVRTAVPPQKWLIEGVFTLGTYGKDVRPLTGIITAPTLRADGTILQAVGYDQKTGLLYQPCDTFPKIPDHPTHPDAARAADELLEVVRDFQFQNEVDKSAWLSMVLSTIGRPSVSGCVPLFAISATCRGSGKTLLADAASIVAFGKPTPKKTFSSNDEELRKAITAIAIEALPCLLLDNVDRTLGGAPLDAALTATVWTDRVLCTSTTTGELPMRTVWIATGNNLRFGTDLARRVIPIRLVPTVENPEERTGFEQPKLLAWVQSNRPRLAVAALTILRAYIVAGKPPQRGGQFGSFEGWSSLIRGAIVWAGLPDPLTTRETAKADDTSGAIVRGLIGGLLEMDDYGDGLTARDIVYRLVSSSDSIYSTMREVVLEVATSKGKIDAKLLGYALRRYRGRIANGCKIDGTTGRLGVVKWKAARVSAGDAGDAGDDSTTPQGNESCVARTNSRPTPATQRLQNRELPESSPASPASPAPQYENCADDEVIF